MEPFASVATAIAPTDKGTSRGAHLEGGVSADETKYDGRHLRDRFVALQRIVILTVLGVIVLMLMGDGLIFRWKRGSALSQGRPARNFRPFPNDVPEAMSHEDELNIERARREAMEAPRWNAGDGSNADPAPVGDEAHEEPRTWQHEEHDGDAATDPAEGSDPLAQRAEAPDIPVDLAPAPVEEGDAPPAGDGPEGVFEQDAPRRALEEVQEPAPDAPPGEEQEAAAAGADAEAPAAPGVDADEDLTPLDWTLETDLSSCNAYFGNGYSIVSNIVSSGGEMGGADNDGGALRCVRNGPTKAVACEARNVILHPGNVAVSRGGEALSEVMGRREDDELATFHPNWIEIVAGDDLSTEDVDSALEVRQGEAISRDALGRAADGLDGTDGPKYGMLSNARVLTSGRQRTCSRIVTEPVIFVTRVEYANLFHTSTDWYNTWQAARLAGVKPTTAYSDELLVGLTPESAAFPPRPHTRRIPAHIVFVDGHNAGPMDEAWLALFLSLNYVKHLPDSICFAHTIWAPYGYHAAISSGLQPKMHECKQNAFVRQFSDDFVRSFGIQPRAESTCAETPTPVLFVRRVNYLAHPRHDGRIVRRLDNEDDIMEALKQEMRGSGSEMRLIEGLFSSMTMLQQVQAAQDACVMVGAHGAGLSHVLFAPPGIHMLELQPPAFQRPHFVAYSTWAGAHHHMWATGTSSPDKNEVVNRIRQTAREAAVDERVGGGDEHR